MNRRQFHGLVLGTLGVTLQAAPRQLLRVDGRRLNGHLAELSEFGRNAQGGVSRIAYSDADRAGREYVLGLMRQAGLETRIDAAGNLRGRRAGRVAGLRPLAMGSHIDTVPEGGNYDGCVGSLAAVEVARTLGEERAALRHPLEILIFQNEEGGQWGSRLLAGEASAGDLDAVSHSGKSVRDGIRSIGGDPERLEADRMKQGDLAAYLELHVEQGGLLESEGIPIGVVEGIVGIHRDAVTVEGFANHAGTTPMNMRQDALLAAARLVEGVNRIVTRVPGRQVGTVGRIEALPGAPNVVPGRVHLTVELRDLDWDKVLRLAEEIREAGREIGRQSKTGFEFRQIYANRPVPCDARLRRVIGEAAGSLGLSHREMPSGAGHDAQGMSRLGPVGMIFVPSVGGISHSPREFSRPEDIAAGADVLLHSLLRLDG